MTTENEITRPNGMTIARTEYGAVVRGELIEKEWRVDKGRNGGWQSIDNTQAPTMVQVIEVLEWKYDALKKQHEEWQQEEQRQRQEQQEEIDKAWEAVTEWHNRKHGGS